MAERVYETDVYVEEPEADRVYEIEDVVAGRVMSSLVGAGGLAGQGGIAGPGGGLAA